MRQLALIGSLVLGACATSSSTPAPASTPVSPTSPSTAVVSTSIRSVPMSGSGVMVEEPVTTTSGAQAAKSFVADVKADETGGECSLNRTTGNGALTATAFYPTRLRSTMQVAVTFDSSGRVVRYFETRGIPHIPTGLRREQVDSARRAIQARLRTTSISFDYATDHAFAMNRGGGKTAIGVMSSVRDMEKLENLGQPAARMDRMRKLCGV